MILGFAHPLEPPPPTTDLLTISDEVREAIRVNMGDMTLAQRFEFTLSFFRFAAIFLAEVGKEISKGQSPDTMALLQLSGAVPHEVGLFNVRGRGRGASVATARSSTPRPSSCPSPRPLDLVPEEEGEGLEGEGHGERYSPEDAAVSSGEYVTVVLDEEDAPAPDVSSLPGGADPSRGLSPDASLPAPPAGTDGEHEDAEEEAVEHPHVASEGDLASLEGQGAGLPEPEEHTPGDWMRLLRSSGSSEEVEVEEREEGDGSALMQMVMKPEQVSLADERLGRMLVALQKALKNSGDKASGRAKVLLYTVTQGRWTCRHAFTGARDSRFRTLEALLATFGASSIDLAGAAGAATSSSSSSDCLLVASMEDREWAENEFQKLRGSHDVLVEPYAQLEVTTSVFQVESNKRRLSGTAPFRLEHQAGAAEGENEGSDDAEEADVGSVEFDEAILLSSQELAPVDLTTPFTIQGCPVALSQAYFTLYLDESITEEFIVDRFGEDILLLFKERRKQHLGLLEGDREPELAASRGPLDTQLDDAACASGW